MAPTSRTKPAPGLFVAQVVGESMSRRIPNGSRCLFRLHPKGSRQGKVVLAALRGPTDSEHGGHYTLKLYESEIEYEHDGSWRHRRILLKPDSTDPDFEPIELEGFEEGDVRIVAELVERLG